MSGSRIVTFTTDFGLRDPFAGILHGVVLSIHRDATVVDICHQVASYDVLDGAWTIAQAYRFFPSRTVHVVVVDPGVGSARRPIVAEASNHFFVAPDNGVLSLVEAREPQFLVRHAIQEKYFLHPVSQTFHGRDIFAPLGAWLSKGVAPAEFGPQISDYVRLPFPAVERAGPNRLRGAVIKVDKFGNLITNISQREAPSLFAGATPKVTILVADETVRCLYRSYAEARGQELFAIVGSSGYLEIAAPQASAAERIAAGVGAAIEIEIVG